MIVVTTNAIEGRPVTDYLGIVHGCAVMGSNLFRDFFAGIRDIVGGRVESYETVMAAAKETAQGNGPWRSCWRAPRRCARTPSSESASIMIRSAATARPS